MSINIQLKQDTSFLFTNLNANNANTVSGLSSLVSDYASIKNGSYGKLMKAYYAEANSDKKAIQNAASKTKESVSALQSARDKQKNALSAEQTKAYTSVQSSTDKLNSSTDKLLANGNSSLFTKKDITTKDENGVETTTNDYDKDAIYSAVSGFVSNYNSVLDATKDVDNSTISNRVSSMQRSTALYSDSLAKVGITINKDNTLSIDKEKFMASDMENVKNLFNKTGSFASSTAVSSSLINSSADSTLAKAATYNTDGSYSNAYNSGNLFSIYS